MVALMWMANIHWKVPPNFGENTGGGLYKYSLSVARSVDFAGDQVKLLGSDGGFVDGDNLVRRWELKFLWFNPLWVILTVAFGVLLIVGAKKLAAAYVGAAGFALIGLVIFFMQTFDYVRAPDGSVQTIGTGSNVAFWGALALGGALVARRLQQSGGSGAVETPSPEERHS
jgi:hypothetical protein